MDDINVTHVTSSVSRRAGGLFESVRHLARSIAASSHVRLNVLGLHDGDTAADVCQWDGLQVTTHPVFGPERFGFAPGMWRDLQVGSIDLLHLHGLWQFPALAAARWGARTRRPYMVSPHGMLEPWALQQSRLRKALASFLYQAACLRRARCLRATSRMEAESIRAAGCRNQVALIPNGVEIPTEAEVRSGALGVEGGEQASGPRRVIFLSRIHPKKGLLNLVEAWRRLSRERGPRGEGSETVSGQPSVDGGPASGWELHIVGPDENGHKAEVMAAVRAAGLAGRIQFPGEVWGPKRLSLYLESDLFVLPSFSENFGLVIAEALGCGLPVITTKATPWDDLASQRCGWWIDVGVEPLVRALREALTLPPRARREMGQRGRQLVERKYAWEPIGRKMVETYEWMLGRGPKPDCIIEG